MTFFQQNTPPLLTTATSTTTTSAATTTTTNTACSCHNHKSTIMRRSLVRKRSLLTPHRSSPLRAVRFDEQEPTVHYCPEDATLSCVEPEQVWFPMEYLQAARKQELKNNLRAQYYAPCNTTTTSTTTGSSSSSSIESDTLTWRGMEDIREHYNRPNKVYEHVQAVLAKQQALGGATTSRAQASLRQYARSLSKCDRRRALQLAASDAQAVYGNKARRTRTTSCRSMSPLRHWSRNVTSSLCRAPGATRRLPVERFHWKFSSNNSSNNSNCCDGISTRTMTSDDDEQ